MMREEAIERIGEQYKVCKEFYHLSANPEKDYPGVMSYMEALDLSLSALRPVSREQVEKVWKGEWIALDECANEGVYCSKCKKKVYRIEYANEKMKSSFCPHCGAPMTDEAVQIVMERLKEVISE